MGASSGNNTATPTGTSSPIGAALAGGVANTGAISPKSLGLTPMDIPAPSSPTQPQTVAPLPANGSLNNPYTQAAGAQQAALQATAQGMGYQPSQVVGTSYQAADPSRMMGTYQNPYESQVVQQTLKDIGQAQDMSMNQLGAQAGAAGAFGGSRHGVAEAQTRLGYGDQAAKAVGQLRQQGFNTALQAAQNQAAAQNMAAQFGAQAGMTAQQLNQSAGLQGAQQRLAGAQQLGNLGQQSFGYGQSIQDRQAQQGALQREQMQNLINQAQGSFGQMTGAPMGLQTFLGACLRSAKHGWSKPIFQARIV
jgi:hypothetical protein